MLGFLTTVSVLGFLRLSVLIFLLRVLALGFRVRGTRFVLVVLLDTSRATRRGSVVLLVDVVGDDREDNDGACLRRGTKIEPRLDGCCGCLRFSLDALGRGSLLGPGSLLGRGIADMRFLFIVD